jgi:hypothetical protein
MMLGRILAEKKPNIIKRWFDVILETYPADTADFLKKQENRFTNPVGSTIYHGIENIFDEILREAAFEKLAPFLDSIIRIRAVQDFTPSKAISFIFSLKKIISEELRSSASEDVVFEELQSLESRIDTLALASFDIFMECKEKIYETKTNEVRRMMYRLLRQANLITETEENETPENNFMDIKRKEAAQ